MMTIADMIINILASAIKPSRLASFSIANFVNIKDINILLVYQKYIENILNKKFIT